VTGAIKDTAIEYEDIAYYAAEYLIEHYPERLKDRYELDVVPETDHELMEAIALRRGCLRAGGHFDIYKVSTILLNELRAGALGPISVETPEMAEVEKVEVVKLMAKQAEEKIAKKEARRRKSRKNRR
jgi:ribosome biogenesis GTPase A